MTQTQTVHLGPDGQPCISTEAIARGCQIPHNAVLKLMPLYMAQITTLGAFAFETRAGLPGDNDDEVELILFNERQASFLVSLIRNTAKIVNFKVRMIHEFWRMHKALAIRDQRLLVQRILQGQHEGDSLRETAFRNAGI